MNQQFIQSNIQHSDFLKDLQGRRARLLDELQPGSLAIVMANTLKVRSHDTNFPFRQNSNYWYLTGVNEPEGVLLLLKNQQNETQTVLFILPSDPEDEIWHGKRLSCEQAVAASGVDSCYTVEQLAEFLSKHLQKLDHLYLNLNETSETSQALLESLENHAYLGDFARLAQQNTQLETHPLAPLIYELRLIKSEIEQQLIRKAALISADAHIRAMQTAQAGHFEYQVAAELHHEFAVQGASGPAYGSICASGENACILHYTENSAELRAGDLLLIDAGAEYQGYAGDISRTFPVSQHFSVAQAQLYDLVLAAQKAACAQVKPGSNLPKAYRACVSVLVEGLIELGILSGSAEQLIKEQAFRPYFMHGLGHWLGLDVHDPSSYHQAGKVRPFEPGMVLTIEPGLYIPKGSACPESYWGIGIRIEDNLLVTDDGYENLTALVPKERAEIEAIRASV